MNTTNLSILLVDDTKFSTAIVSKLLVDAGYKDIRIAHSAAEALDLIKERGIDILLADWLMPEMDGLELSQKVRELDNATGLYTYIMLLTAKEGIDDISVAFDAGVDDFINKSLIKEQLVARFLAATRLVKREQSLRNQIKKLAKAKRSLEMVNQVDLLTGLGNRKYAIHRIQDTLNFVGSRKGALCYIHFEILNFDEILKSHPKKIVHQVLYAFGKRLQQLSRPRDAITRISQAGFSVVQHQHSIDICDGKIFKRIVDGLSLKPYKTDSGYISLSIGASLIGLDDRTHPLPTPQEITLRAKEGLPKLQDNLAIESYHWPR